MEESAEEALVVVSLFRGFAPPSPRPDSGANCGVENKRFKPVDQQLLEAENLFLGTRAVSTEGKTLDNFASRFSSHEMPSKHTPEREYMSGLVESTVTDAINTASPVMIGHMTSSLPYYSRPLARMITTMNQNSVKTETANTVTFLERQALCELHKQMFKRDNEFYDQYSQNPAVALGVLTSGGTIANITALWVARNRAIPGVDQVGMLQACQTSLPTGCTGIVCIGSELLHYSMTKALDLLGLGWQSLVRVPVDETFSAPVHLVRKAALEAKEQGKLVLCIIGLAGSTEAGSFDDLNGLADLAQELGCHFHVDAAWGGPAIFSKTLSKRLVGLERADTVALDGHKQLYVPLGCGLLFFRDPDYSLAVRKTAGYIIRQDSHDLGKFTLEGSRPANAVHLHSNLHILGIRGYEILVDRSTRITQFMANRVRQSSEFELLVEPQANILLYRAVLSSEKNFQVDSSTLEENEEMNALNIRLQEAQRLRGKTFVSRTTIRSPLARHHGARIVALRVVIANPLTYEDDVEHVLRDQLEILASFNTSPSAQALDHQTNEVKEKQGEEEEEPKPQKQKYWSAMWEKMDPQSRALFHNSEEQFIGSLISPDLEVQSGIMKDPRYEKHIH
ncbi:hypothetical protein BASA81_002443 [Batrachochytrium salamandrivorans]|nr:hypothetical protein BASA81_002443 [Batrachochytrium salamandrivorans]